MSKSFKTTLSFFWIMCNNPFVCVFVCLLLLRSTLTCNQSRSQIFNSLHCIHMYHYLVVSLSHRLHAALEIHTGGGGLALASFLHLCVSMSLRHCPYVFLTGARFCENVVKYSGASSSARVSYFLCKMCVVGNDVLGVKLLQHYQVATGYFTMLSLNRVQSIALHCCCTITSPALSLCMSIYQTRLPSLPPCFLIFR